MFFVSFLNRFQLLQWWTYVGCLRLKLSALTVLKPFQECTNIIVFIKAFIRKYLPTNHVRVSQHYSDPFCNDFVTKMIVSLCMSVLLSYSLYKHIQITFDNHKVCIYTIRYCVIIQNQNKKYPLVKKSNIFIIHLFHTKYSSNVLIYFLTYCSRLEQWYTNCNWTLFGVSLILSLTFVLMLLLTRMVWSLNNISL